MGSELHAQVAIRAREHRFRRHRRRGQMRCSPPLALTLLAVVATRTGYTAAATAQPHRLRPQSSLSGLTVQERNPSLYKRSSYAVGGGERGRRALAQYASLPQPKTIAGLAVSTCLDSCQKDLYPPRHRSWGCCQHKATPTTTTTMRRRRRRSAGKHPLSVHTIRRSRELLKPHAGPIQAIQDTFLRDLGQDSLIFLGTTVVMVPLFKKLKQSPVLGYLLAGFLLKQFGLFQENAEISTLSELGVQFLLFDMGLELSVDRLKALAKYAFGMGIPQILLTGGVFSGILLPPGHAIGTAVINKFTHMNENFLNIMSIDEAVVIGLALSLSSSAFVLQILGDRGQLSTKFGAATLGVLLMQDIAVVPLLVALPILEKSGSMPIDKASLSIMGAAFLKAMGGLGLLVLISRLFLRRVFEVVAQTRSPETFVALCLFTCTGIASLTSKLGFSDTLGAFLAGALLADTNYRAQVEADLRPFKGLLLGLFFVTTGARVEWDMIVQEWPVIMVMLTGLFSIKTFLTALSGRLAGLSPAEAIRTGFLLSQGGEFAFVVLSLAQQLGVLPEQLNRVLVIVVILSLFATPSLSEFGALAANKLEESTRQERNIRESIRKSDPTLPLGSSSLEGTKLSLPPQDADGALAITREEISPSSSPPPPPAAAPAAAATPPEAEKVKELQEPVIICGFGRKGQVLASMLSSPLLSRTVDYIALDYDPDVVDLAQAEGFRVVYGEAAPNLVSSLGLGTPRAIVVTFDEIEKSISAVSQFKSAYPQIPVFATARDMRHAILLDKAGADSEIVEINQNAMALCKQVLSRVGTPTFGDSGSDISSVFNVLSQGIEARARELDWEDDGTPLGARQAAKDLYVYGGAQNIMNEISLSTAESKKSQQQLLPFDAAGVDVGDEDKSTRKRSK